MVKFWFALCILFSTAIHGLGLNDPVSCETSRYLMKTSDDVSAFFVPSADEEAICIAIDRGEYRPPLFYLLTNPQGESLNIFLNACEKALQKTSAEGGMRRIGIVHSGQFFQTQISQWQEKISAEQHKSAKAIPLALFGHPPIQILTDETSLSPQLLLSYAFRLPVPKVYRDLRKLWVIGLIQQMTKERLVAAEEIVPVCAVDPTEFLLPVSSLRIGLPFEEQNWQKNLHQVLQKIKSISEVGFTMDELLSAKKSFLVLAQGLQKEKNASARAAFLAQAFLRDLSSLDYELFVDSANALIESITPVDIAIVLHECFSSNGRTISYLGAHPVDQAWTLLAEQTIDLVEKGMSERIAPLQTAMSAPEELFEQLSITEEDRTMIYRIIDTMARDNVIKLGWKRKSMEKKGRKVRHVHPLRFLGHVFSDPHLHHCMREVHRSGFKWNGFIDGMKDRIEEEAERGGLVPYVPGFAKQVQRNEQKIRHYIEKRDWEALVRYLL